ncbi:hypothetical protein C8R45DRAFT_90728 [Mycena sanguinolenta]|nr:hypothetical protein C8R45DRAFT_90728 [Mycena sanguinolenta]
MDQPSWSDTLRATIGSCLCLTCARSTSGSGSGDANSDDEYTNSNPGVRGVRRARPDELEGLLADSASGDAQDDGWGHDDAAADPDALSLHSHLGPRGRRRPPPRTPRHISLWGFDLFGSGRGKGRVVLEGGDEALHSGASSAGAGNGEATPAPKPPRAPQGAEGDAPPRRCAGGGAAYTRQRDVRGLRCHDFSPLLLTHDFSFARDTRPLPPPRPAPTPRRRRASASGGRRRSRRPRRPRVRAPCAEADGRVSIPISLKWAELEFGKRGGAVFACRRFVFLPSFVRYQC